MPPNIFSESWDDLTAEAINEFLASEVDEGLLWEAKSDGREPLGQHIVRKAVCGFANSDQGGYLIVGAHQVGGRWELSGLASPPAGELTTWLENLIATGVAPVPKHSIKGMAGTGGPCAIVSVDPVAVPPALTSAGAVYERVSGATNPVTDQTELARLFAQARTARLRAELEATEAVGQAFNYPVIPELVSIYSVALAPASPRGARSMMTQETYDAARTVVHTWTLGNGGAEVTQTYFRTWSEIGDFSFLCRSTYGAAFTFAAPAPDNGILALDASDGTRLREAWQAVLDVLSTAGVSGAGALAVAATGRRATPTVVRPLDSLEVDMSVIASVIREMVRSEGRGDWEPS
jgi:Putative DNA-binding domain